VYKFVHDFDKLLRPAISRICLLAALAKTMQLMLTKIINAGLTIALAVVCAHWFWVFAAPRPVSVAAIAAPDAALAVAAIQRARLFGATPAVSNTVVDNTGLRLNGIYSDTQGGIAVIAMGNDRAVTVRAGSEVKPGILLERIERDHVIIRRNGVEQRVGLPEYKRLDTPPAASSGTVRQP
jgi:type II secretory pathway component PulC